MITFIFDINISKTMNSVHDVIIIGVGASGIAASYTLTKLKIPHIII